MFELRGLAYCTATRPTLTTGTLAPYVRTTAICSSVRVVLCRCGSVLRSNVSAQSPPWSRNALPCATSASCARRPSISAGATIGGTVSRVCRTASSADRSGHCGCWAAGSSRHRSRPGTSSAGSGRLTHFRVRRCPRSAEEHLCLGVALRRNQLELCRGGRQGPPDDVGPPQRHHHAGLAVVHGVDRGQPEA